MSYQVLARKLRPGQFADLVGQEHVVRALTHALDHDRLHHAYLFTGTRGVGKTTVGRILAKCLNCEKGVSASPCGECGACTAIAENRFVDLIEVDAASRTGVDATRELLENAQYLPTQGRYKVYLIDEVHMLTTQSFNALLKTLEEPPEHVKFLLATTDPKKVPVTVLSRCLQFQLKNLSVDRIATYLQQVLQAESIAVDPEALASLAAAARGSMRDALSLTDQAIAFGDGALKGEEVAQMLGSVGGSEVEALLDALAAQDASRLLEITAELSAKGLDLATVLEALLNALHALAVNSATGAAKEGAFDGETLQLYYQIALTGYRDLPWSPDTRVGLEMTLLRMLAFTQDSPQRQSSNPPARTRSQGSESKGSEPKGSEPKGKAQSSRPPVSSSVKGKAPPVVSSVAAVPAPKQQVAPQQTQSTEAWAELVAELPLSGVTRMIAEHSVRIDTPDNIVKLKLNPAHDTLLNDRQIAMLEKAIHKKLGESCQLRIDIGASTLETPAQQIQRLQQQRQQAAERQLEADPNIQGLLSEFGGELVAVRSRDNPRRPS